MKDIKLKNPNDYINLPDINIDLKKVPENLAEKDRVHVKWKDMVASPTNGEIEKTLEEFKAMPNKQRKFLHKKISKCVLAVKKKITNDIALSSLERSNLADDISLLVCLESAMTGEQIEILGVN